ncbi:GTP-binding protein [Grosmannia clavigera kw1407]|uniref:GTP-binding protein n=1 Tax=Grosmannia clavigera (strain kw1407 / UAMH 11150) TaxID=655863 RepID=F0X9U1_GROCL|nr:GTP-binding protein [Grosmannia clavigera kw1407]EFX06018.1 GTP-binding protein [Grosmannia clavigera kw1407]
MQSNLRGPWVLAFSLPLRRKAIDAICSPIPSRRAGNCRQQQQCFSSGRPTAAAVRVSRPTRPTKTTKPTNTAKTAKTTKPAPTAKPRPTTPASSPVPRRDEVVRSLAYVPALLGDGVEAGAAAAASAPMPSSLSLDRATALFLQPAPRFLYSAPRFLHLPVNTRMPEICILGRSNVGKSTLLNALAGLETGGRAGRSHGARPGRLGLAITSAHAGCTVMMNGYGFGPPLRPGTVVFDSREGDTNSNKKNNKSATATTLASRSQRRAQKPGEPSPAHSLVLLDMPGYGFMSRSEWGTEIAKYLQRRTTLRGAVLLVDAVAGIKDGDRQALAMLRDANVRTTVVLTKADKLLGSGSTSGSSALAGDEKIRESCLHVWETLRSIERDSWGAVPWMEGQGWDRAVLVTGAGDPKGGGFGVAGTRLAICRMAGLVQTARPKAAAERNRSSSKTAKNTPKHANTTKNTTKSTDTDVPVVPFDQIRWTETSTESAIDQTEERRIIADMEAARQEKKAQAALASSGRARPWRRRTAGRPSAST